MRILYRHRQECKFMIKKVVHKLKSTNNNVHYLLALLIKRTIFNLICDIPTSNCKYF